MRFLPLAIAGAWRIEPERRGDDRGDFARVFCRDEFAAHGLETLFPQTNHSRSRKAGTIRGLHWQAGDAAEVKLIRATRGAVFDVMVDLRPDSPTFGRWEGVRIDAPEGAMVYVPRGCAHGFQTLEPETEVSYPVSHPYRPQAERGLRWDDPAIGIRWPLPVAVVSEKDAAWPDLSLHDLRVAAP